MEHFDVANAASASLDSSFSRKSFPLALSAVVEALTSDANRFRGESLRAASAVSQHVSKIATKLEDVSADCVYLCLDSALRKNGDAAAVAASRGAKLIVGSNRAKLLELSDRAECGIILVDPPKRDEVDPVTRAARHLARMARDQFDIPVIAITGASGKTTTKDLTASIVARRAHALVTQGNNNNVWGTTSTLIGINALHDCAILEFGMNAQRQVCAMSAIARPTITYTTSIAPSHLEFLGNIENVLAAETEQYQWMSDHGTNNIFLTNLQDPLLAEYFSKIAPQLSQTGRVVSVSGEIGASTDVAPTWAVERFDGEVFCTDFKLRTPWGEISGSIPLLGAHNLSNACAASALALASGVVTIADVIDGLAAPKLTSNRSELFRSPEGFLVFNDSYNANPGSMRVALRAAANNPATACGAIDRVVAIVSDMRELGPNAQQFHYDCGVFAAQNGISALYATGDFREAWKHGYYDGGGESGDIFESQTELLNQVRAELTNGANSTLILVKASKGSDLMSLARELRIGRRAKDSE